MLDLIKDSSETFISEYTKLLNIGAILDAMANVKIFNDAGLNDYEEGFNLIVNEIDGYGETMDLTRDALQDVGRYVSVNLPTKDKWAPGDWFKANILLASADDDEVDFDELLYDCLDEAEALYADDYDLYVAKLTVCRAFDIDELSTDYDEWMAQYIDPYDAGDAMIGNLNTIAASAKDDFIEAIAADENSVKAMLTTMQESFTDMTVSGYFDTVLDDTHLGGYGDTADWNTYSDTHSFDYVVDDSDGDGSVNTSAVIYTNAPGGSGQVSNVIDVLNEIYYIVEQLEFTTAIISANTKEGNAPLTVTFDALDSYDPTEYTIQDSQYHWDLGGNGLSEMMAAVGGDAFYTAEDDKVGPSVSYTYEEPGTYRVALRVDSNSPEEVASGISYMSIKVNSPSSIINLTAQVQLESDATPEDVSEEDEWEVTGEQAKAGVIFDASATTDGDGNADTIVSFDWDFGDGEKSSGESSTATYYYSAEGEYDFVLEVTDQNGVTDRKNLIVVVASPAADINYADSDFDGVGEINDTIWFSAAESVTDNGTIENYTWTVSKDGSVIETEETNYDNSTEPTEWEYKFTEPGEYTVGVSVVDSNNLTNDDSIDVTIDTNEPAAAFDFETPDETHPNRIHFDATESYDVDDYNASNNTYGNEGLTYEWSIDGTEGTDYDFVEVTDAYSEKPVIDFYAAQDWEVTLTVYNNYDGDLQKSGIYTRKVSVDSILSIESEIDGSAAVILDAEGAAEITLNLTSNVGVSYEVDWADSGEKETIPVTTVGATQTVVHKYDAPGTYPVNIIVYDESNATNKMTRNVYIGNGETPIPIINVYVDNVESADANEVTGTRISEFRFEGGDSIDVDGNVINERDSYTWDFGDGANLASGERNTHKYDEVGAYEVKLTVVSPSDRTKSSSAIITLNIEDAAPEIYSFTAQLDPLEEDLITPVTIDFTVNADDEDGTIESYKFWYFDVSNSSESLNTQISSDGTTSLTISTNGITGETTTYGFAVEITDDENNTVSSLDELTDAQQPTMEIENGTNIPPVADFTVSKTSVMKDDTVTFNSSSYDEDGEIRYYNWDLEGDGFTEDGWTQESSVTYTYETVAKDGIQVRLKVKDDLSATDTSDAITIYVDTDTKDPAAQFNFMVNPDNSNPLEMAFYDSSYVDPDVEDETLAIVGWEWDFDLATSTDDNDDPDDDVDSIEQYPIYSYTAPGTYEVRLIVTDSEGNTGEISRDVEVASIPGPEADFEHSVPDEEDWLTVEFDDNSGFGEVVEGASIVKWIWEFDLGNDSDGLGTQIDDLVTITDASQYPYTYTYDLENYTSVDGEEIITLEPTVQLTVTDYLGRESVAITEKLTLKEPKLTDLTSYFWSDLGDTNNNIYLELEDLDNITDEDPLNDSVDIPLYFGAYGVSGTAYFCIDQDDDFNSNHDDDGLSSDDCDPVTFSGAGVPLETIHEITANENGDADGGYTSIHFQRGWAGPSGQNTMQLTVTDDGTEDDSTRVITSEILVQFEDIPEEEDETIPGATSMLPVTNMEALYILAIAFFFTLIGAKIYIGQGVSETLDLDS
ncbi:PKD domain-containing protein [Candidatus Peregrinibacteria bacterium]|nr:PKD domain-containing protein [Candidatus Peregrinibacteria bacterium]